MDKIKARRLDRIGYGAGSGAEPEEAEEAEEEGRLEERNRKTTKGHCTGMGYDDYEDYALPHPESEAAAASSDSEPEIPFAFRPRYAGSPPILKE